MLRAFELFLQFEIITQGSILKKMNDLQTFVRDQQAIVDEMKYYNELEIDIQKSVLDVRQNIVELKNQKAFGSLIKYMIQIMDFKVEIDTKLRQDEKHSKTALDETVSKIDITFQDTIQWLLEDAAEFLRFGYELKKYETQQNKNLDYFTDG